MRIRNNASSYGLASICLHWLMAVMIIGMYFLGEYMVDLDYYDKWYHQAPWWHKSIGVSVLILLVVRIVFRVTSPKVAALSGYKHWELIIAKVTHIGFYIVILFICLSGYLVATAKGAPLDVFSLFDIPAMVKLDEGLTDFAAEVHEFCVHLILIMLVFHVLAALKHHFIDRDSTLIRMFGGKK